VDDLCRLNADRFVEGGGEIRPRRSDVQFVIAFADRCKK
jgi:hypothetical protein